MGLLAFALFVDFTDFCFVINQCLFLKIPFRAVATKSFPKDRKRATASRSPILTVSQYCQSLAGDCFVGRFKDSTNTKWQECDSLKDYYPFSFLYIYICIYLFF